MLDNLLGTRVTQVRRMFNDVLDETAEVLNPLFVACWKCMKQFTADGRVSIWKEVYATCRFVWVNSVFSEDH